jgi:subtilisin family serine protease
VWTALASACQTLKPTEDNQVRIRSLGEEITLVVDTGQIGVLTAAGASEAELKRIAAESGLTVAQRFPDNVLLFDLDASRSRPDIVDLGFELVEAYPQSILQAGFVVRPEDGKDALMIITNEIIVQFRVTATERASNTLVADLGLRTIQQNRFVPGQFLVALEKGAAADAVAVSRLLEESEFVEFAHPNFIIPVVYRQAIPNDPLFVNHWHHQNTGQSGGTVDADIDTPLAWNITTGNANVIIAVIDSGFDFTHPDLAGNLWTNAGEIAGNNIDDDNNGFVDDINGWNFTANSGVLNVARHGTSVAGSAVSTTNNNLGVAGSCQQCQLMLLRNGNSTFSRSQAFGYAQAMGASIITNSWGFNIGSAIPQALQNAINAAATNGRGNLGAVIFWAMNNPSNNDCVGATPDLSSLPNVIAVSRVTNLDQFNAGGFGNCMDVLGPTANGTLWIVTTDIQGNPGYNNANAPATCPSVQPGPPPANARDYTLCFNGTSAATPILAGAAGLVLAVSPNLTRLQVQQLLQDTSDKTEDSLGAYATTTGFSTPATAVATHGFGRANAFEAVRAVAPVAQGGLGGVDVFLRDNRLDWGNTEQPSNTLFESTRGFIGHWRSEDIKIDAPPFQTAPTAATFDAFVDETPSAIAGDVNRVYVRARNRGPVTAASVTVKLYWTQFGTALPPLPPDFWTSFPTNSTDPTSRWNPLNCNGGAASCSINNLAYSGTSVAGAPGDPAQIVQFDFPAPPIDPALANHFCLLGMISSPQDGISANSQATFVVDTITPTDNNVTHRNYHNLSSGGRSDFRESFFIRNPGYEPARAVLTLKAPKGWEVQLDGAEFNSPFALDPAEEILATLTVQAPGIGQSGEIEIVQETTIGQITSYGGLIFDFRPPALKINKYASINGLALVGDPATQSIVAYLGDGTGYGMKENDTFSFAPILLPHGAIIKNIECVFRDNSTQGYIQATLNRGPINVTDPIVPIQSIASATTSPAFASSSFTEVGGSANVARANVDNDNYGYFFRVDFLDNPSLSGSDIPLKLRGCSVEYTE